MLYTDIYQVNIQQINSAIAEWEENKETPPSSAPHFSLLFLPKSY